MAARSSMIPGLEALQGSSPSTSGIVTRFDSEDRVIPESRRADGTVRKERRVRPGFTPPEDVGKFRSARQQDMDARKLPPGVVPGMGSSAARPEVKAALAGMSASAKKNQKRKEKRKEDGPASAVNAAPEEPPESWDAEDEPSTSKTTADAVPVAAEPKAPVDPQKRAKALQKKIRQIEDIKQKHEKGETLQPEQQEKLDSLKSLEDELADLAL